MGSTASSTLRIAIALGLVVIGLTGCAPATGPSANAPVPTPSSTAADERPAVFVPGGTAAENHAWFDAVNAELLAVDPMPGGRAIIDTLASAGFDTSTMEVSRDETPMGHRADAVQFSVRVDDECLLGQASPAGYSSVRASVLATGTCLVGQTRPIDW